MQLTINTDDCNKCMECVEYCPGDALNTQFIDNYPVWDKSKCTFCETCNDLCETGAIICQWD